MTVGRRLAVMKNGFHLYRCYLENGSSPEPLPVPTSALTEVKALDWYLLDSLDRDRWRFAYQFELFLEVASNAILEEQAGQQ